MGVINQLMQTVFKNVTTISENLMDIGIKLDDKFSRLTNVENRIVDLTDRLSILEANFCINEIVDQSNRKCNPVLFNFPEDKTPNRL